MDIIGMKIPKCKICQATIPDPEFLSEMTHGVKFPLKDVKFELTISKEWPFCHTCMQNAVKQFATYFINLMRT